MRHVFLSDAHLVPHPRPHPGRERLMAFLEETGSWEPGAFWVLGDLFEYWFEYGTVAPAGHSEVLWAFRRLHDRGWELHFIPGNHDWWVGRFFREATGFRIHRETPLLVEVSGLHAVLAHGDGLGRGDWGYRAFLKPLLRSGLARLLFSTVHPSMASRMAGLVGGTSRRVLRKQVRSIPRHLEEWAEEQLARADLVVTGHTHVPRLTTGPEGVFASLGDWMGSFTYLIVEEGKPRLEQFHG